MMGLFMTRLGLMLESGWTHIFQYWQGAQMTIWVTISDSEYSHVFLRNEHDHD